MQGPPRNIEHIRDALGPVFMYKNTIVGNINSGRVGPMALQMKSLRRYINKNPGDLSSSQLLFIDHFILRVPRLIIDSNTKVSLRAAFRHTLSPRLAILTPYS